MLLLGKRKFFDATKHILVNILVRKREDYGNMNRDFEKSILNDNETLNVALDKDDTRACKGLIHKVKKGDTLYKISKMYDVRLVDVLRENPYVNVYNIQIGDEICIPTELYDGEDRRYYNARVGDTFKEVISRIDTNVEKLFEYNKELFDLPIPLGTVLRIPEN